MRTPLIIGTRGSDLALWQANFVKSLLAGIGLASEIQIIKTQGDLIQHLSFDKLEGKGFLQKKLKKHCSMAAQILLFIPTKIFLPNHPRN